jgi:glutamine synthetase
MSADEKIELKLSVIKVPQILLDNTDRNRTSLVAFTGDKFELRAIGSSANIAVPMIVLNSAVAEQLVEFKKEVDRLVNKNIKKYEALFQVLRQYIIDSKSILFEGNNYSDEWKKKAASWGLSNIGSSVEALDAYLTPKSRNLLGSLNIMNERENEAHAYVRWNNYTNCVQIETRVMEDLILHHIIPVVIRFQTELIESINGLKGLLGEKEYKEQAGERIELIRTISHHVSYIKAKVAEMIEARNVACKIEDERLKAMEYSTKIFCYLDDIRNHVDNLELIVDDEYWPLPKYRELLFIR